MMIKIKVSLFLLLFMTVTLQAEWQDSLNEAWKSTKEISGEALESSKKYTHQALDKSKHYYDNLTNDFVAPDLVTPEFIQQEKKQHIQVIWKDILANLDTALTLNNEIDKAPASRFFGADKKSLGDDQIDVFKEIEALLSNPEINKNRQHIDDLKQKIAEKNSNIAQYMEQRVVADADDREDYNKKISKEQTAIKDLSQRINNEKDSLRRRFNASGLLLSDAQVDVLLSRVDSDDIIKMALVYDVLADITEQLMGLTKESNENIQQARKYYGMHVVLLKLVINMQDNYVAKLDQEYLPKIEKIRKETNRINQESIHLLAKEGKHERRNVLRKNINAQRLTLNVAKLYTEQLTQQRTKVIKARNLVASDYNVAKNTYDTVKISADLIRLMKTNRASFNALMNIQIPEIVPFENLAMQRKFEELSSLIK
ncbi:MAG: hypothetical protein KAG28_01315 [Cocleimonas sp.]|nr:hypothetical protein [Cocleimonas sp.]